MSIESVGKMRPNSEAGVAHDLVGVGPTQLVVRTRTGAIHSRVRIPRSGFGRSSQLTRRISPQRGRGAWEADTLRACKCARSQPINSMRRMFDRFFFGSRPRRVMDHRAYLVTLGSCFSVMSRRTQPTNDSNQVYG